MKRQHKDPAYLIICLIIFVGVLLFLLGIKPTFIDMIKPGSDTELKVRGDTDASDVSDMQITYLNLGPEESANGISWRWTEGNSAVIQFSNVGNNDTLQVTYWVPYSLYQQTNPEIAQKIEIDVYLNDVLYYQQSCDSDKVFTVYIPPEARNGKDVSIEIRSPFVFPMESIGGDSSFQILSAGKVE